MGEYVLAIDPSGNFEEGKGITGWCLIEKENIKIIKFGMIKATQYKTKEEYWHAHLELIDSMQGFGVHLVVEDYRIYANRAKTQINSKLETPKLLGIIELEAFYRGIPITLQMAASVKKRWADNILVHKGLIKEKGNKYELNNVTLTDHIKDAIRHGVHYVTFGGKK